MSRKFSALCVLMAVLLALVFGTASASESAVGLSPTKLNNQYLSGGEELPISDVVSGSIGASRSPGIMIGDSYYDMQNNGSIGRRVVFTYEDPHDLFCGLHFIWMCMPCEGGSRHIRYNARHYDNTWEYPIGPSGGISVSDANGGYSSIDVTHRGAAVIAYHSGPTGDTYSAKVCVDALPPDADLDCGVNPGPPNCEGWFTGSYEPTSKYIWPMVEADVCGDDTVFHKVATESPPAGAPNGEIQTVVYYKDVWNHVVQTVVPPVCGTAVDSVYDISAVVRQDPRSSEVAIIWMHPIHYNDDPNDPCGYTQWQNDVYVWKSSDCGDTWDRSEITNVTDYTQGGTIPITQCTELAYNDLSALYDHHGVLHVVWSTPLRDVSGSPCTPLYASRMWHWDDSPTGTITMVYDASTPRFMNDPGAWNSSTCKMNISECNGWLYCSFTRFGAHTSADGDTSLDASTGGYENGDIFLVSSTDGGQTWADPINLTNTDSDGCTAGDCESEHWSTMAKYSNDSVHIQFIEDKDAGAWPQGEGAMTCNPVRYITYPCFPPPFICGDADGSGDVDID
ncbi:MAG: hypothetical protein KAT85_10055, partial [candidate division Zixibacteria bacterium]|nr:hypothetical protein [candidate division Zixibacteria bacterium]